MRTIAIAIAITATAVIAITLAASEAPQQNRLSPHERVSAAVDGARLYIADTNNYLIRRVELNLIFANGFEQ